MTFKYLIFVDIPHPLPVIKCPFDNWISWAASNRETETAIKNSIKYFGDRSMATLVITVIT